MIRFVKLAYNYENWDAFDILSPAVVDEMKEHPNNGYFMAQCKIINLLSAMTSVISSRLRKKFVSLKSEDLGDNLSKNCKLFYQ